MLTDRLKKVKRQGILTTIREEKRYNIRQQDKEKTVHRYKVTELAHHNGVNYYLDLKPDFYVL